MTNKELIQKADLALSDLASYGKLNPEQTNRFIRRLIDTPTILNRCRTVAMTAPDMKINRILFGSRILRKPNGNVALDETNAGGWDRTRAKPTIDGVSLSTKEVIAEVNIPYDVIEDNIEKGKVDGSLQEGAGGLHQTIVDLIAERAALDLEELLLLGDTASGDAYLALIDGFLKKVTSNVVNAGSATFSKDLVKAGLKAMPTRFLRNRQSMVHFVSVNNETELRDTYANRQTAAGDTHLAGNNPLYVFGSEVKGAALMPAANGLFCDPQNLIFGIQRNIQIEYTKDIRARVFVIVLTARVASAIEEEPACVKYTTIG